MIRKKPREISAQRTVSSPNTSVSVGPPALGLRFGSFFKNGLPSCIPERESCGELRFGAFGKRECEDTEFPRSLGLRFSREILGNGFHLVELAMLDREAPKYPSYTSSSVNDGSLDVDTLLCKRVQPFTVDERCFGTHFLPPQILFQKRSAKYTHAVTPAPERYVGRDNEGLWSEYVWHHLHRIQLFLDPDMTVPGCVGKLSDTLATPDVLVEEPMLFTGGFARRLKRVPTCAAPIPLDTTRSAVLFCP